MGKRGGALSRFSVENFLFQSAEKARKGTLLCFRKIFGIKKLWIGGGGVITILSKFFLSHSTEKFRGGTHPGSRKILVWKLINKVKKCR